VRWSRRRDLLGSAVARGETGRRCGKQQPALRTLVVSVLQDIARLAVQRLADRFQGRKADGFGLFIFQDGKIRQRDAHLLGELGDAHFSFRQHDVDIDDDLDYLE
jgi:hypothetical protein